MLLGADIHVFINHKNLMFDTLKMKYVLRWRTKIEEFTPILHYIEGPHNILADNLSRLNRLVTLAQTTEGKKLIEPAEVPNEGGDKAYFLDQQYSGVYDEEVWEHNECYLNFPDTSHLDENSLNYAHIRELQQQATGQTTACSTSKISRQLCQLTTGCQHQYGIICYKKDPNQPNWKIVMPKSMVFDTVKWFYQVMGHPGKKRLQETLN
jgi:hypothetical protein